MTSAYPMLSIGAGAFLAFAAATLVAWGAVYAGFPLPPLSRRIGCIDGLRGYLALSVLVHHFVIWVQITRLGGAWAAPSVNILNNLGAGGVALFFMTTGLVFYPRILSGFRATSWPATYISRLFRILPLQAFSVLVVTLVIMARTGAWPDLGYLRDAAVWMTAWGQPPLLGYPNAGRIDAYVLWSLWYEWIFYILVLPVCALAMDVIRGRLPSWSVPAALLAASLIARQMPGLPTTHWLGLRNLPYFTPLFAIGMLAFEAQKFSRLKAFLEGPITAILAVLSLVFGMTSAPTPYAVPQLCAFGFFFVAVANGNSLGGVLRTKGALALGAGSYGIYLLHGVALSLLFVERRPLMDNLTTSQIFLALPLVAFVVACAALLTYVLIERPMIAAGSRVARGTGRALGVDAPQAEVAP